MHSVFRSLKMALNTFRRNAMRSALTTLGIVIGIAAVIAMMEIGQGSARSIAQRIQRMGADTFYIRSGAASSSGISFGAESVTTLIPSDVEAILRECPSVREAAPMVRSRLRTIYGNKNWDPGFVYGTTPAFLDVRDWVVEEGEMFNDKDVRGMTKVCLLGQTIVRELFGEESPIGKEVRLQNVNLRVIGVLSKKGSDMMGMDQDDVVVAPWTTVKFRLSSKSLTATMNEQMAKPDPATQINTISKLYPNEILKLYPERSANQLVNNPQPIRIANIDQIAVRATSPDEVPMAIKQITDLLRERHRIKAGQSDDFSIRNMAESARALSETTNLMMRLLLFVALVSLVVGGVGIMNIMLVSVTERTREIGLRMAVGARSSDILRQFLVEALLLCLLGGLIGILLGRGGSILMRELLNFPTLLSVPAIVASVGVAATVGIVFGFYPAWKASRLDPIQALRYE